MRFDSYHPAINAIFFVAAILCSIAFRQPVYLLLSFCCAACYLTKLRGSKGLLFSLSLLPFVVLFSLWYGFYHHFGVTVLRHNFIGNSVTLESLLCGLTIGLAAASVLLWLGCMHAIFTADKIVYLFGRISPRLSLFLSMLLRMVPRLKAQYRRINDSQRALGLGSDQGNLLQRLHHRLRILSILITWLTESFITSSESMKSRGYTLRGRTAFSIYRFDHRDRILVVVFFSCFTVLAMAFLLDQTEILFDPYLVITPITPISYLFYVIYASFCLTPMALQCIGEHLFTRARGQVHS